MDLIYGASGNAVKMTISNEARQEWITFLDRVLTVQIFTGLGFFNF